MVLIISIELLRGGQRGVSRLAPHRPRLSRFIPEKLKLSKLRLYEQRLYRFQGLKIFKFQQCTLKLQQFSLGLNIHNTYQYN